MSGLSTILFNVSFLPLFPNWCLLRLNSDQNFRVPVELSGPPGSSFSRLCVSPVVTMNQNNIFYYSRLNTNRSVHIRPFNLNGVSMFTMPSLCVSFPFITISGLLLRDVCMSLKKPIFSVTDMSYSRRFVQKQSSLYGVPHSYLLSRNRQDFRHVFLQQNIRSNQETSVTNYFI